MNEVISDQTLKNWYHSIKLIHCNKSLLTMKCGLSFYCYYSYLPSRVLQTDILKNAFYGVGQGSLGMSLWNKGGGGPKKFGNHSFRMSDKLFRTHNQNSLGVNDAGITASSLGSNICGILKGSDNGV
jgi:hypothetical protein